QQRHRRSAATTARPGLGALARAHRRACDDSANGRVMSVGCRPGSGLSRRTFAPSGGSFRDRRREQAPLAGRGRAPEHEWAWATSVTRWTGFTMPQRRAFPFTNSSEEPPNRGNFMLRLTTPPRLPATAPARAPWPTRVRWRRLGRRLGRRRRG